VKLESEELLLNRLSPPAAARTSGWGIALGAIAIAVVALLVLYRETALSMVAIWLSSDTYAHGFLIAPLALVLVWRNRADIARNVPTPDLLGFALLAAAGFAWLVASAAQVQVGQQYAMTAMIPAAVLAIAGRRVAWALAFPLAFLFFAVPFGEAFLPRLMDWTANFTVAALRLTGIPVYREGNFFSIPSGHWSVVEACSGLRYLIASVTIGTLYAYVTYRRWWKRLAFFALSIIVPIAANFLRAYMIVMIGHLSSMKLAVGVDHFIYGWVFFGIVIGLLFWLGSYWRDIPLRVPPEVRAVANKPSTAATAGAALGVVILVAIGPLYAAHLDRRSGGQAAVILASPAGASGWTLAADELTDWRPRYAGATASVFQVYRKGDKSIALYVGYYRHQRQGAELISSQNTVQAPPGWRQVASAVRNESMGSGALKLRETHLRSPAKRLLVWEWFRIGDRELSDPFLAKALLARDRLLGRSDDSAVIILAAPYEARPEAAAESLRQFAREMRPSLHVVLAPANQENRQ
jgi:exosortase A